MIDQPVQLAAVFLGNDLSAVVRIHQEAAILPAHPDDEVSR